MRDNIQKLMKENEHLTQELVVSKTGLRGEMDKVLKGIRIETTLAVLSSLLLLLVFSSKRGLICLAKRVGLTKRLVTQHNS